MGVQRFSNSLLKRNPDRDTFWDFAAPVTADVEGRWVRDFGARFLGAALGCTVALFPLGWRFAFSLLEWVVRLLHGTDGSVFRRGSAREGFEEGQAHSWTVSPKALRRGPVRFFTGGVGFSSFGARYFFFAGAPGTGAVTASASRLPGVVR